MSSKNSNVSLYNSKYLKYKNKYLSLKKMLGGKDDNKIHLIAPDKDDNNKRHLIAPDKDDDNKRYLIVSSPDKDHPYLITLKKEDKLLPEIAKQLNKPINQIRVVQNGVEFNDSNKSVENYGIGNTLIKINPVITKKDDILPIIKELVKLHENEFDIIDKNTNKIIAKNTTNEQRLIDILMGSISFDGAGNIMDILLMNYNLKKLPDNFINIKLLGNLNLRNNKLETLPENFGTINVGGSLHLENNQLEKLPETFGNITVGDSLYLDNNNLITLPETFGNINIGKNINLGNNKLKSLPNSFKNIDGSHDVYLYGNLISGKIQERQHMTEIQKSYAQLEVDNNKAKEIIRQRK